MKEKDEVLCELGFSYLLSLKGLVLYNKCFLFKKWNEPVKVSSTLEYKQTGQSIYMSALVLPENVLRSFLAGLAFLQLTFHFLRARAVKNKSATFFHILLALSPKEIFQKEDILKIEGYLLWPRNYRTIPLRTFIPRANPHNIIWSQDPSVFIYTSVTEVAG